MLISLATKLLDNLTDSLIFGTMITKKTEYAIRALWELHLEPEKMKTANQVAQRQAIPPKYLPQIVSQLNQSGLLVSLRGYGGGIKLNKPANEINVLDIIIAIQGHPILFECQHDASECTLGNSCGLLEVYNKGLKAMLDVFRNTLLHDLKLKVRN